MKYVTAGFDDPSSRLVDALTAEIGRLREREWELLDLLRVVNEARLRAVLGSVKNVRQVKKALADSAHEVGRWK